MKYTCENCNFKTNRNSNFQNHLITRKHLYLSDNKNSKINPTNNGSGNSNGNGNDNYDILLQKEVTELKFEIERKNFEIEKIKLKNQITEEKLKSTETINEMLKKDKEHNNFIQKENTQIIKTSMNALSFVKSQFYNAPPLHYFNKTKNLFIHKKNTKGEVIINYYKKKKLVQYIGNELLKEYKKNNPHEQSFWSSDTVRKNMLFNKQMTNKKTKWIQDKSGLQIANYAIDPIIKSIKIHTDPLKDITPKNVLDNKATE